MLNRNSVASIYSLAQQAEQAGVVVLPHAETPLAVLNSTIGTISRADDIDVALVSASESTDVLGDKEHSQAIDELVTIAATAVRKQLKFARELVTPVSTDAFERVSKYLDEAPIQELRHSIKEVSCPAVYSVAGLQDLVDRYKSQPQITLQPFGNRMPEMSAEDLIDRVKTGMSGVDKALTEMIEANTGIASRVYDEYFLGKGGTFGEQQGNGKAETVVAYVLARSFNSNVPSGVNEELGFFREQTAHFMAEFGRRIFQELRKQDRIVRQKDLIAHMPLADNIGAEIQVNSSVYQAFLKEGGTPEAIIGTCLRGINRPTYADLLEDAHGGEKAVKVQERILQSRIVNEYEANVHNAIIEVFGQIIAANEFPEGMTAPTVRDVRDWLKANPFRKKFDLDRFCLRAVCGALFPNYNAYPVLSGIMSHKENNPELSNREAATMVTIDLVGEWLAAQLTTERE